MDPLVPDQPSQRVKRTKARLLEKTRLRPLEAPKRPRAQDCLVARYKHWQGSKSRLHEIFPEDNYTIMSIFGKPQEWFH